MGTRRATSVPVLHALLHSFCCSKTDAASKAERRLVMNYIANCYCEENRSSAHLLDGIRTDGDVYELENVETVSEVRSGPHDVMESACSNSGEIFKATGRFSRVPSRAQCQPHSWTTARAQNFAY